MSKASNKDQQLAALRSLLAEKESQISKLQQLAGAAQASSAAQSQKLAENNASLARTNARLVTQVDRLTKQCTQLQHLCSGQQAIAKAKQAELSSEINSLKNLLQESMVERRSLSAQLSSKQDIINYLEWRLLQIQHMCSTTLTGNSGASMVLPPPRGSISPLLRVPGNKMNVVGPVDLQDFNVFSDRNGPQPFFAGASERTDGVVQEHAFDGDENKENTEARGTVPANRRRSVRFSGIDTVRESPVGTHQPRTPLADITPQPHHTTHALTSRISEHHRPLSEGAFQTPTTSLLRFPSSSMNDNTVPPMQVTDNHVDVVESDTASDTASQTTPRIAASQLSHQNPSLPPTSEEQEEDGGGDIAKSDAVMDNIVRENMDQTEQLGRRSSTTGEEEERRDGGDSSQNTSSHPDDSVSIRSSSRQRNRVSYALPSVRSKLRQGDPFTFGETKTSKSIQKTPGTRNRRKSRDCNHHHHHQRDSKSDTSTRDQASSMH